MEPGHLRRRRYGRRVAHHRTGSPTTVAPTEPDRVTLLKFDGTVNHVGTGHNGGQFQIEGDFSGGDIRLLNSVTIEVKALMRDANKGSTELIDGLPFMMHPDRANSPHARSGTYKSPKLATGQQARMDLSTRDTGSNNWHFKFRMDHETVGSPVCTEGGTTAHLGFDFVFTVGHYPPSPPPSPPDAPPSPPSPPLPPALHGQGYPTGIG